MENSSLRRDIADDNSHPESRIPASRKRAVRLRLIVALPVLMALLALVSGYSAKFIADYMMPVERPSDSPEMVFAEGYVNNILLIAAPFAGLGGLAIAYVILAPLRRISRELQSVAHGGVAHNLEISTGDEIGALGENINRMMQNMMRYLPERARFIFHNMASGVVTFNHQGIITSINGAADRMLELKGVGINGRLYDEFFRSFGDMRELVEILDETRHTRTPATCREVQVRCRSGKRLNLGVSTTLVQEPGNTFEVLVTLMDLSTIKQVSDHLLQSDKLSAIGSLAAGVAHEIRNPLGSMRGLSQLLLEDTALQGKDREYLEMIKSETDRLNEVVTRLLDFARPAKDLAEPCNFNMLMSRARDLAGHAIRKDQIEVVEDYAPDLPELLVDGKRLLQAVLNLVLNAAEATGARGRIRLSTRHEEEAGRVIMEVVNTGSHIAPEARKRIFHPFYTTKDGGTGLGLAITSQIVDEHGGEIWVDEPRPNETLFGIALPDETARFRKRPEAAMAAGETGVA